MCQVVFGEEGFFVEAQVAGDGTDKAAIENAAREFVPIFVLESLEETGTYARGGSDFFRCDFAKLALSLETLSENAPGHWLLVKKSVTEAGNSY
jgi:hypothetical protein